MRTLGIVGAGPPAVAALAEALRACGVQAEGEIDLTIQRLVNLPYALLEPLLYPPDPDNDAHTAAIVRAAQPDDDMPARLLRFAEGQPDPNTRWIDLLRPARKRADSLWSWVCSRNTFRKGPPPAVDSARVLYNVRVIEKACGRQIKFKRLCGAADGPMIQAVMAALAAQQAVPSLPSHIARYSSDTVGEIISVTRKAAFAAWCKVFGLADNPDGIAQAAETFRYVIGRARAGPPPDPPA